MYDDTWLKICIIGLPLIGALTIWLLGRRYPRAQRWLIAALFGAVGIMALALFINSYDSCILASGRQNCFFEGLTALFLLGLGLILARVSLADHLSRQAAKVGDYALMLLMISALAGIGLAENLLELFIFLNLFLYLVHRWLTTRGLKWRILALRDDYKDETR